MGNFYITKQPNFEGKKFKFVGTTIVSWNVSHEQLLSKKNYLIAVIMSTLDEKKLSYDYLGKPCLWLPFSIFNIPLLAAGCKELFSGVSLHSLIYCSYNELIH